MRRLLARLLVLGMVPVLIVATPNVASAASTFGPTVNEKITIANGVIPGDTASCALRAMWVATGSAYGVQSLSACSFGWNFGHDDDWTMTYTWEGSTPTGDYCEATTINSADSLGVYSHGSASSDGDVSGCHFQDVCWYFEGYQQSWITQGWETHEGCQPVDLGPMGSSTSGSCAAADFETPSVGPPDGTKVSGVVKGWYRPTGIKGSHPPGATAPGYNWMYYALMEHTGSGQFTGGTWTTYTGGTSDMVTGNSKVFLKPIRYHFIGITHADVASLVTRNFPTSPWYSSGPGSEVGRILGVGVIGVRSDNTTALRWRSDVSGGKIGMNIPSECTFYWGEKVDDVPNTDIDEPLGPLGGAPTGSTEPPDSTVPVPDDPNAGGCSFKWTDPTTWATAGICQVVEVLLWIGDKLMAGLQALLDAVEALWDGFTGLWVPDTGFLDDRVQVLRDDFNDTQPGAYVESIAGQSYGFTDSGCGGIPVDWSIAGQSFDFDLLRACTGYMATTAGIVKLVGTVLLWVFGGIACVRALGSGFGWSPTIGRGAEV